jgi:T3SS negative regulator,GrlR
VIENGLYMMNFRATDGVDAVGSGVIILRDGIILGGNSHFYYVGTYSCFEGKWKGELTVQEHTAAPIDRPLAGKIVSAGFSGIYSGVEAAASVTTLAGKRSIRYEITLQRLIAASSLKDRIYEYAL